MKKRFDQLSPEARIKARSEVLAAEREALQRDIAETRLQSIHALVNNPRIRGLVNILRVVRKLENPATGDHIIRRNLCDFQEDGTYIRYMARAAR